MTIYKNALRKAFSTGVCKIMQVFPTSCCFKIQTNWCTKIACKHCSFILRSSKTSDRRFYESKISKHFPIF
eukprot:UN05511